MFYFCTVLFSFIISSVCISNEEFLGLNWNISLKLMREWIEHFHLIWLNVPCVDCLFSFCLPVVLRWIKLTSVFVVFFLMIISGLGCCGFAIGLFFDYLREELVWFVTCFFFKLASSYAWYKFFFLLSTVVGFGIWAKLGTEQQKSGESWSCHGFVCIVLIQVWLFVCWGFQVWDHFEKQNYYRVWKEWQIN